jgi:Ca2+-binding EF-hand superfamily protein
LKDLKSKLRKSLDNKELKKQFQSLEKKSTTLSYLLRRIGDSILEHFPNCDSKTLHLKASQLFGGRSESLLTRAQLRSISSSRLGCEFNDENIETIFQALDPYCNGHIKIRQLIDRSLNAAASHNETPQRSDVQSFVEESVTSESGGNFADNQDAMVSYDRKFRGLQAPNPESCPPMSIKELEEIIRDRVFERTHLGANMMQ